jgi:hypothetical protein
MLLCTWWFWRLWYHTPEQPRFPDNGGSIGIRI